MKLLIINAEAELGAGLSEVLNKAKLLAIRLGCGIRIKFNGHVFRIYEDSDIEKLYKRFHKID